LNGRLVILGENQSLVDSVVLIFFLQQRAMGYQVLVNKDGTFKLPLAFDVEGDEPIFYTAQSKSGDIRNITIDWETENLPPGTAPAVVVNREKQQYIDPYGFYASRRQLIHQSYFRLTAAHTKTENPNAVFEEELDGVDIVRVVSEYNAFPNMVELVREILPAVEARQKNGKTVIRVYTTHKRPRDNFQPLFIIDGNFYKDPDVFMGLLPNDIVNIKIVKDIRKLRNFGPIADNGIILVTTKSRHTKPPLTQFTLHGIPTTHHAEMYSGNWTVPSRTPDLRPCLLWMPETTLSSNGLQVTFNTSDDLGSYVIQVEGRTMDNRTFVEELDFVVTR
jgi:hypothetical protein